MVSTSKFHDVSCEGEAKLWKLQQTALAGVPDESRKAAADRTCSELISLEDAACSALFGGHQDELAEEALREIISQLKRSGATLGLRNLVSQCSSALTSKVLKTGTCERSTVTAYHGHRLNCSCGAKEAVMPQCDFKSHACLADAISTFDQSEIGCRPGNGGYVWVDDWNELWHAFNITCLQLPEAHRAPVPLVGTVLALRLHCAFQERFNATLGTVRPGRVLFMLGWPESQLPWQCCNVVIPDAARMPCI